MKKRGGKQGGCLHVIALDRYGICLGHPIDVGGKEEARGVRGVDQSDSHGACGLGSNDDRIQRGLVDHWFIEL